MRMRIKLLAGFLSLCLMMALDSVTCLASDQEAPAGSGADHKTTYTITLYAGKQGTLTAQGEPSASGGQIH